MSILKKTTTLKPLSTVYDITEYLKKLEEEKGVDLIKMTLYSDGSGSVWAGCDYTDAEFYEELNPIK